MVLVQESFVELFVDIELNGVIASSNGLDVPVYILGLLNSFHIVKVSHNKKEDKHKDASNHQPLNLPGHHIVIRDNTRKLNEESCRLTALPFFLVEVGGVSSHWVDHAVELDGATLLIMALLLDLLVDKVVIEESRAVVGVWV